MGDLPIVESDLVLSCLDGFLWFEEWSESGSEFDGVPAVHGCLCVCVRVSVCLARRGKE